MLNTILRSTNSGKSNFHIGEEWTVGRTKVQIVGYFDHLGVRYYIGAEKILKDRHPDDPDSYLYHVLYKYQGKWRRMD